MIKLCLLASVAVALPGTARAEFSGTIDMKMTSPAGGGTMKLVIGKAGVRSEIDVQVPSLPMKTTVIVRHSNPDLAYKIDDETKTYVEQDLKKVRESAKNFAAKYTAKKLGKEKMLGYDCVHALLSSSHGDELEVWTTKEFLDYELFLRATGRHGLADEGMMKALKDVGADGFIIKLIHRSSKDPKGAPVMTMEVVSVDKKAPPASAFEIPAGYKKADEPGMGGLPPGVAERLKNMTPEQREAMMKAFQKHAPPPQ